MSAEQGAHMTPRSEFEAWWKGRLALRSFPIPDDALPFAHGYAEAAWEAGYRAAVKAHDASGCPGIFMEKQP